MPAAAPLNRAEEIVLLSLRPFITDYFSPGSYGKALRHRMATARMISYIAYLGEAYLVAHFRKEE